MNLVQSWLTMFETCYSFSYLVEHCPFCSIMIQPCWILYVCAPYKYIRTLCSLVQLCTKHLLYWHSTYKTCSNLLNPTYKYRQSQSQNTDFGSQEARTIPYSSQSFTNNNIQSWHSTRAMEQVQLSSSPILFCVYSLIRDWIISFSSTSILSYFVININIADLLPTRLLICIIITPLLKSSYYLIILLCICIHHTLRCSLWTRNKFSQNVLQLNNFFVLHLE